MKGWSATLESIVLSSRRMGVVRDAVLVAAGLGTRMFPASAFLPKETLPLVDVPLLTHLVLEAKAAGIERFHVVISPSKSFEGMFDDQRSMHALRSHLDEQLFNAASGMDIFTHVQKEPKGVANAIEAALHAVEGPFLVMLGDNLLMDIHAPTTQYKPTSASKHLLEAYEHSGTAMVALMEVDEADVHHYGIVQLEGNIITDLIEKPQLSEAPSRLAMCGRYIFPADMKQRLQQVTFEEHGDMQSIALQRQWMQEGLLQGLVLQNTSWYDSGSPMKWLQAQVDHALRRSDLQPEFSAWLRTRLADQR